MEAKLADGQIFEWQKGTLEVVPCTPVKLVMEPVSTGSPSITLWDLKEAIKIVTKGASEPLYVDLDIGRDRSVATVAFEDTEAAELVQTTLDTRVVPIGKGRHKVSVTRVEEEQGAWKAKFFKGEADASQAVQEELFKKAAPGKRPDTVVLRGLPCKWFGLRSEEEDGEGEAEGEGEGLMPLWQSLGWWVVAAEAQRVGEGGRHFDAYVQLRKLSDVQAALSVLPRRAVRYVPSGKVVPVRLEVDDTGFFVETVKDERRARLQREREARRANREKLRNARKEREALEASTNRILDKGRDVEEQESVGRAVATLQDLFKRARRLEGQADEEGLSPEGKSLRDLVSTLGQVKAQMSVTERTIRDCQHAAAEAKEREAQEQRAATVREMRVALAKELRPIEESWRSSLSSERLKGAAKTTYGGAMAKAAHEAVDAARDLLLQKVEGPLSENDLKERLKRLQRAVEESSCCVAKGVAGLELQADVTELQARLDRALEEGFHDDEEDEEEAEGAAGGSPSSSAAGSVWRWPFPLTLHDDPSFASAHAQATSALQELESLLGKAVDPKDDKAAQALETLRQSVEGVMGPRRRRHRAVVPRARQLDRLVKRWRELVESEESVKRAAEAAELAVKRAYKGVEEARRGEAKEDEEELVEVMEKAVDRLETAAAGVARRRREAEEAKQRAEEEARRREEREKERARRRLEMAREREEAETQARVADAEKRRAFLQKTLDIREAHKRLRQYREHVISQPPPTQRLLQAGGLQLVLKGRLSSKDDESTAPEEEEKLIIMTPVPILNRYRGWAGRDALPEESVANDVSEYYWKEVHDEEEEEGEDKFVYPPELRLKTVMIKISEAPKRPRQDRPMTNAEQNRAKRRLKSAAVVVSRQEEEDRPEEEVRTVRRRGAVVVPGAAE